MYITFFKGSDFLLNSIIEKLDKIILFFLIYTILFLLFFGTISYTLPFVLAFIFAYILQSPTKFLIKKFKLGNSLAALITTVLFFSIILFLLFWGITILISELIQLGKILQLSSYYDPLVIYKCLDKLQSYYKKLDPSIANSIKSSFTNNISDISNYLVSFTGKVTLYLLNLVASIPYILMVILFTLLTTYFFTKDMTYAKTAVLNIIPEDKTKSISFIFIETKKMLSKYISSYLIIITITFLETLAGFLFLGIKYSLILSILSGILDLLPLLGIGTIYIPLSIIYLLSGKYITAATIVMLYALVTLVRNIIEPKLVSSTLGINPVSALAAIFIGLKASGISGIIFCMFLLIFYNIFKKVNII